MEKFGVKDLRRSQNDPILSQSKIPTQEDLLWLDGEMLTAAPPPASRLPGSCLLSSLNFGNCSPVLSYSL